MEVEVDFEADGALPSLAEEEWDEVWNGRRIQWKRGDPRGLSSLVSPPREVERSLSGRVGKRDSFSHGTGPDPFQNLLRSSLPYPIPYGEFIDGPGGKQTVLQFLQTYAQHSGDRDDLLFPKPEKLISFSYSIGRGQDPSLGLGFINGIDNKLADSLSTAAYFLSFAPGCKFDIVYNRSHGAAVDLLEIFGLNYLGLSPVTSDLLRKNWSEFHEANRELPNAKYLQFCHSQGTIHVRNALQSSPLEIRERVIVIGLGCAIVIPQGLCYDSLNYASEKDLVNWGEFLGSGLRDYGRDADPFPFEEPLKNRERLILLPCHPEENSLLSIDHSVQSKTFADVIQSNLDRFLTK